MKLKVPNGCGGVSWGGQAYPVVDGEVEVPAAAELTQPGWGFTPAPQKPGVPEPKTENRKLKTGT